MDVDDLVEIEAIKQLKYRYLRYLDQNRTQEMADLFIEDATATYSDGKWTLNSRAEIVAFLGRRKRISLHTAHHPEISLTSKTTATGIWTLEDTQFYEDGSALHGAAYYEDTYIKDEGGWRISSTGYRRSFEHRSRYQGTLTEGPGGT